MTNPETKAGPRRNAGNERAGQVPDSTSPASDLQPEDAGTAASGTPASGNAAQAAMKQFAKTESESGSRREDGGR